MLELKLSLDGLGALENRVAAMQERAQDLTPVWGVAHDLFRVEMYGQFESEGKQILGSEWQPLSPKYAATKPETPTPFGILYRTGKLYRSLVEENHPNHVKRISASEAVFGTNVTNDEGAPYPVFHQTGATRDFTRKDGTTGTAVLPARPIIGFRPAFKQMLTRVMLTYVLSGRTPDGIEDADELAYHWR